MATKTKKAPKKGNTFEEYILERLRKAEEEAENRLRAMRILANQISDLKERCGELTMQIGALKKHINVREIDWHGEPQWVFEMESVYPCDESHKELEGLLIIEEQRRNQG